MNDKATAEEDEINSDLDDPDEEDPENDEEGAETGDVVIALYEKVRRHAVMLSDWRLTEGECRSNELRINGRLRSRMASFLSEARITSLVNVAGQYHLLSTSSRSLTSRTASLNGNLTSPLFILVSLHLHCNSHSLIVVTPSLLARACQREA